QLYQLVVSIEAVRATTSAILIRDQFYGCKVITQSDTGVCLDAFEQCVDDSAASGIIRVDDTTGVVSAFPSQMIRISCVRVRIRSKGDPQFQQPVDAIRIIFHSE